VTREFAAFLLAGGIAALANIASRMAFSLVMPLAPAVVLAYLVGMVVAFFLMRSRVFAPGRGSLGRQAGLFALVNLAAVAQTLVVTFALARWAFPALGITDHAEDIAHVIGVGVPIVTSYFGHKHLSFR
jgi:putative flippase GtrA